MLDKPGLETNCNFGGFICTCGKVVVTQILKNAQLNWELIFDNKIIGQADAYPTKIRSEQLTILEKRQGSQ